MVRLCPRHTQAVGTKSQQTTTTNNWNIRVQRSLRDPARADGVKQLVRQGGSAAAADLLTDGPTGKDPAGEFVQGSGDVDSREGFGQIRAVQVCDGT